MAFQGSLEELPLPDVIQLVAASGKTGRFRVEHPTGPGEIFLKSGAIVHSSVRELAGEEAFYELATWQRGEFVFEPLSETPEATISKSNTNLLMAAAQRIDEWKVLVTRVPSTRMVPVFVEGGNTPVSLTAAEWQVVRKVDERRSIEEISRVLGVGSFEVSKTLYGLVTSGLVELQEDPGKLPFDRLQEMSDEQLESFLSQLGNAVDGFLSDAAALDAVTRTAEDAIGSGRGAEAVAELIRSQERTISSTHGPTRAEAYLETVTRLLAEA